MHPLFIFATQKEAQSLLEALPFHKIADNLWQASSCFLLVSGIGALASSYQFLRALEKIPTPPYVVNMGVAASLSDSTLYSCWEISQVRKAQERKPIDSHSQIFFETLFPPVEMTPSKKAPGLALAHLLSVDLPLHDTQERFLRLQEAQELGLQEKALLLDMEGYALTYSAKEAGHLLYIIKCVSDFAQEKKEKLLQKTIPICSQRLCAIALSWLKQDQSL